MLTGQTKLLTCLILGLALTSGQSRTTQGQGGRALVGPEASSRSSPAASLDAQAADRLVSPRTDAIFSDDPADFTPAEIVGQIGGGAYAIATDPEIPGRVYMNVGPRVQALDLSVPDDPVVLGESAILPSVVEDLVATGGVVYATGPAGLAVIDFRAPAQPEVTRFLRIHEWTTEWGYHFGDWNMPHVHLGEGRLFLARNKYVSRIEVFDLADPAQPEPAMTLAIGAEVIRLGAMASHGDRLVVAFDGDDHVGVLGGLAFFDLGRAGDAHSGRMLAQRVQRIASSMGHVAIRGEEIVLGDSRCPLRIATGGWDRPLTTRTCQAIPHGGLSLRHIDDRLLVFVGRDTIWWYDWSDRDAIRPVGFHEQFTYDLEPAGDGRTWYAALSSAGLQVLRFEHDSRVVEHGRAAIYGGRTRGQPQLLRMGAWLLAGLPNGLRLMDLQDPHQPRTIDSIVELGKAELIEISETKLLATAGATVEVVAIETEGRLTRLGSWEAPDRILDVAVEGKRAAVLWETTNLRHYLSLLDLSDPTEPREIGQVRTYATHETALFSGEQVILIGGGYLEIFTVDGAEGPDPIFLSRHHIPQLFYGCQLLHAGFAYCGGRSGLDVVDLRDLDAPRIVSEIDRVAGFTFRCDRPRFADGQLFCPQSQNVGAAAGSWRLDTSDPARPQPMDRIVETEGVWDIVEIDGLLYLLTVDPSSSVQTGENEILVLEVSGGSNLRQIGAVHPLGYPEDVQIIDDRAYISMAEGVAALDISEPGQVRPTWRLPIYRGADRIRVAGDRLYFTTPASYYRAEDETATQIHIYDRSEPDHPRPLATIERESFVGDLEVDGEGRLYLAEREGLVVLDVRDPEHVEAIGRLPSRADLVGRPGGTHLLEISGNRAFIVDSISFAWSDRDDHGEPDRFRVIDISDPRAPVELGSVDLGNRGGWSGVRELLVAGDQAWIAMQTNTHAGTFWQVDVSQADNPRLVATWTPDFDELMTGIVRYGRYALMAGWSGVWAIDTQAAGGPQEVARVPMPNSAMYSAQAAVADDGTLWFANGNAGMVATRIDFAGLPTATPGPSPTRRPLPTAAPTSTPIGTGTDVPAAPADIYLPRLQR